MTSLRRIELWAALAALGALAALSVRGAFLGAEGAGGLFTSVPLAVFWAFLVTLLVAGVLTFPRLRRSPGLLALHAGFVLIVAGAFFGSQTGHRIAAALSGHAGPLAGYMAIQEGEVSNTLADAAFAREVGRLPFSIQADSFQVKYYPAEPWMLIAETPWPQGHATAKGEPYAQVSVPWKLGRAARIRGTDDTVTVLQYLPSARATFPEGSAAVVGITAPGGALRELPAKVGASVTLDDPKATVRVVKLFANLRVIGSGAEMKVTDAPGPAQNPAVEVSVERPDGTAQPSYVSALMPNHANGYEQLSFSYKAPTPSGAEAAPDGLPAMELLVQHGARQIHGWLIVSEGTMQNADGSRFVALSLEGPSPGQTPAPNLYLLERPPQVKSWRATLTVLEEGRPALSRIVEVNHPLVYGGYRFCLLSWGPQMITLSARSDSGLLLVYLGFAGVGVGAFWWMWLQPVWAYLTGRRRMANAA